MSPPCSCGFSRNHLAHNHCSSANFILRRHRTRIFGRCMDSRLGSSRFLRRRVMDFSDQRHCGAYRIHHHNYLGRHCLPAFALSPPVGILRSRLEQDHIVEASLFGMGGQALHGYERSVRRVWQLRLNRYQSAESSDSSHLTEVST